jgi:hypothetical protein
MGLFDFFRRKKKEEERIAREREKRLEENRKKEKERQERLKAEREQEESIQPFTFKSDCHQRYENNVPVMGLQECSRTVSVIKNTDGCPGYKLEPGIGYIVKVYNDDLGKPNMSDKPMKVVSKSADKVELRGFPIEARSPFGWQKVDYTDYGFVVYYKDGKVENCVLHMYDRNVRLEYMQKKVSTTANQSTSGKTGQSKLTETETFVNEAMTQLAFGRDGDEVYHPLFKAWRSFQDDPSQLQRINKEGQFGMGCMIFLSFGTVSDIDDQQQLASIAYLFLSRAIEKNPIDVNLYKNRLILMISNHEAFQYTVSSVVSSGGGYDFLSMNMSPFKARDAMFKMEYSDLLRDNRLLQIDMLKQIYLDLKNKIANGFFGANETEQTIQSDGNKTHNKVLLYLNNKVITEEDIDF